MTCISYALGEETNSWTKVGESEQSTRRGGDSMLLWYFSLPIILFLFLHWDIYVVRILLSLRRSYSYCSWYIDSTTWSLHKCYSYVVATWEFLTIYFATLYWWTTLLLPLSYFH